MGVTRIIGWWFISFQLTGRCRCQWLQQVGSTLLLLALIPILASAQEAQAPAPAQAQPGTLPKAQSSLEPPATQQVSGPTVNGIIRNPETKPIPGAIVRLTNTDTKRSWVSWTDESGRFEFPALPPGRYHIEVSQLGFVPDRKSVV